MKSHGPDRVYPRDFEHNIQQVNNIYCTDGQSKIFCTEKNYGCANYATMTTQSKYIRKLRKLGQLAAKENKIFSENLALINPLFW